jgi:hypothetical protein
VRKPREGSKTLTFLFRPRLVHSSLLHLLSSWKVDSANFALTEFYEVALVGSYLHASARPDAGEKASIGMGVLLARLGLESDVKEAAYRSKDEDECCSVDLLPPWSGAWGFFIPVLPYLHSSP